MSFVNYQDLQNAVKGWLNREDTETIDRIPDFITFAENRIFRGLRSRYNEEIKIFDAQLLNNTQGIVLPPDFKEVKTVTYDEKMLERKSDQWFQTRDPLAASGIPLYFARIGPNLVFWRSSDQNSDVVLIYYHQQAHISDGDTPLLYTQFPEAYLFGALLEALPFLQHQDQASIWENKFTQVMGSIMDDSWEAEYAGSTVSVSGAYDDGALRRSTVRGI